MGTSVQLTFIYLVTDIRMQRSINMLYPLELYDEQTDISSGDVTSQDAGHSENKSVKSMKLPTWQAVITARQKINKFLENNALTVLFTIM